MKEVFDTFSKHAKDYDSWFKEHKDVFEAELSLLGYLVPNSGIGLEIGVGTGLFAYNLGIKLGIDMADGMLRIAESRGIKVFKASAYELPFKDKEFDFVLMNTLLCFLKSPDQAFNEAYRVLKSSGRLIIGMIDKNSYLGKYYEDKKAKSPYYRYASFYSVKEIMSLLSKKFSSFFILQTLFEEEDLRFNIEHGFGKGGFVGISALKNN